MNSIEEGRKSGYVRTCPNSAGTPGVASKAGLVVKAMVEIGGSCSPSSAARTLTLGVLLQANQTNLISLIGS